MTPESETPDYTRCSIEDLYDVKRRIDASRFPERAAALEAEIAARQAGIRRQLTTDAPERAPAPRWFRDSRTLGIYMIVSGGWALAATHDASLATPSGVSLYLLFIPFTVYGLLLIAGALTLFRLSGWRWVALVAWGVQVPSFRIGKVAYSVFALPAIEWKIWPLQGFAATFDVQCSVTIFNEPQPLYLGVNAIALSAAGFLVDRIVRRMAARQRQEIHRSLGVQNAG